MVENQEKIDWLEEANNLKNKGEKYWKPTPGQHKVVFLSDGTPTTSEFEGKTIDKINFEVEIKGERFIWSVTKGMTKSSLFGQLALIAKSKDGNLNGEVINLVVKGVKKDTSYTVLEALPLMEVKSE